MIQTLEAVVDTTGKIRLLTKIHLKQSRRALVTILDEEPKEKQVSKKENLRSVFDKMRGLEMFRGIENVSQWQRNMRDEWE